MTSRTNHLPENFLSSEFENQESELHTIDRWAAIHAAQTGSNPGASGYFVRWTREQGIDPNRPITELQYRLLLNRAARRAAKDLYSTGYQRQRSCASWLFIMLCMALVIAGVVVLLPIIL